MLETNQETDKGESQVKEWKMGLECGISRPIEQPPVWPKTNVVMSSGAHKYIM